MENEVIDAPNTLRDALETSFELAESGNLPEVVSATDTVDRNRAADGKFVKAEVTAPIDKPIGNPSPVATTHDVPEVQSLQRPTTWKKEYLPLWDKMQSGQPLTQEEATKFLQYANQRETEYKTGVSTYKGEAENARVLQEAIAPFIPDLQKYGIHPAAWINNLGRAHQTLALGNDEQKLDAFIKLANEYKVPLQNLLGGQQPDQSYIQSRQELLTLQQQVDNLAKWKETENNARINSEIHRVESDKDKFPHFEAVRGTMAQLLESGMAPDLETAYSKAVRMQDDVWQIEQERLLNSAKAESAKTLHVAKAKAAAVSVKSATPTNTANNQSAKDRRSALSSAFEEMGGGRL